MIFSVEHSRCSLTVFCKGSYVYSSIYIVVVSVAVTLQFLCVGSLSLAYLKVFSPQTSVIKDVFNLIICLVTLPVYVEPHLNLQLLRWSHVFKVEQLPYISSGRPTPQKTNSRFSLVLNQQSSPWGRWDWSMMDAN